MNPDTVIQSAKVENMLNPYPAPKKPALKKNLARELDYILANKGSNPAPEQIKNLAVFGSRTLFGKRVLEIIEKHANALHASMIVTAAEPAGVCKTAQEYAKLHKMPLLVHFLDIKKYARGAHEHRSDHVIQTSDLVLLIHDGKSQGTYNEVLRAIKLKKPFIYERLPLDKDRNLLSGV